MFHFRFWKLGKWFDVVIDDRLPFCTNEKKLLFCSNPKQPNEFWGSLIEKAYAKFVGCYESLGRGWTDGDLSALFNSCYIKK
jgi:uncharacterized protein YbbC (DUF1343 family)